MTELQVADTPLWLSHHWPGSYDRCAVVAGRHICRRCLWMYSTALVTAIVTSIGGWWPSALDPWSIALLPLPAVIDFIGDNLRWSSYSARRQAWLSALGAVGAGRGYLRYLDNHTDPVVVTTVLVYGAICLAAVLIRTRR